MFQQSMFIFIWLICKKGEAMNLIQIWYRARFGPYLTVWLTYHLLLCYLNWIWWEKRIKIGKGLTIRPFTLEIKPSYCEKEKPKYISTCDQSSSFILYDSSETDIKTVTWGSDKFYIWTDLAIYLLKLIIIRKDLQIDRYLARLPDIICLKRKILDCGWWWKLISK